MRITGCVIAAIITIVLIYFLDNQQTLSGSKTPRFGFFLSPQKGFWQNAEPANETFNGNLNFPQLKGNTEVFFDERLVPHVYAENENDAWFVQGYLHAKFRLWQMELQMYAAGGRLSEIMGDVSLILIMSVNPGFGGQKFIENTYRKIAALDGYRKKFGYNFKIEVDGGVNLNNAPRLVREGVDILVAGSFVFTSPDPVQTIAELGNS